MKEANETLSAEEVARPGQSLLSTLKIFVEGLDYDPQLHVYRSMKELVSSVSQLEARLAVLEQREGNNPARGSGLFCSGCGCRIFRLRRGVWRSDQWITGDRQPDCAA